MRWCEGGVSGAREGGAGHQEGNPNARVEVQCMHLVARYFNIAQLYDRLYGAFGVSIRLINTS